MTAGKNNQIILSTNCIIQNHKICPLDTYELAKQLLGGENVYLHQPQSQHKNTYTFTDKQTHTTHQLTISPQGNCYQIKFTPCRKFKNPGPMFDVIEDQFKTDHLHYNNPL